MHLTYKPCHCVRDGQPSGWCHSCEGEGELAVLHDEDVDVNNINSGETTMHKVLYTTLVITIGGMLAVIYGLTHEIEGFQIQRVGYERVSDAKPKVVTRQMAQADTLKDIFNIGQEPVYTKEDNAKLAEIYAKAEAAAERKHKHKR